MKGYNESCGCARKHLAVADVNLQEVQGMVIRDCSVNKCNLSKSTVHSANTAWKSLCVVEEEHLNEMINESTDSDLTKRLSSMLDDIRLARQKLMLTKAPIKGADVKVDSNFNNSIAEVKKAVTDAENDLDSIGLEYAQEQMQCDRCVDYTSGGVAKDVKVPELKAVEITEVPEVIEAGDKLEDAQGDEPDIIEVPELPDLPEIPEIPEMLESIKVPELPELPDTPGVNKVPMLPPDPPLVPPVNLIINMIMKAKK